MYTTPTDPEAFERHYREVHAPLAQQLPGLRRYSLSRDVTTVRGDVRYYLVAQLEWDNAEALHAAFNSPQGRAAANDMTHLTALASVQSLIYNTHEDLLPKPSLPLQLPLLPLRHRNTSPDQECCEDRLSPRNDQRDGRCSATGHEIVGT